MAGLDVPKFVFIWFQRFLFIVAGALPHKTTFWQTSIEDQLVVKILLLLDWNKITLKAIEKYLYGLQKLYRNTLNRIRMGFFSPNRRTHGPRTAITEFSCVSSLVRLSPVSHSVSKLSYDQPQNTAALHSKLVKSKESLYRCFSCFVKMCINIHPPQSHVHWCHHLLNTSRPSLIFSRPSHSLDKLKLSLNKYIRHWRNVLGNNSPHYVVLDNVVGAN